MEREPKFTARLRPIWRTREVKTLYERVVQWARNNKAIVAGTLIVTVLGALFPVIKGALETAKLLAEPRPTLESIAARLASQSTEMRAQALQELVTASQSSEKAMRSGLPLLTLHVRNAARNDSERSMPRLDMNESSALLRALGDLLVHAEKTWAIEFEPDLSGVDFRKVNLRGVSLRRVVLVHAHLEEAVLDNADLSFARLSDVRLERASAVLVNFSRARITSSCLEETDLRQAKFAKANVVGSDLNSARLEGADLSGVIVEDSKLSGVSMDGVNLSGAVLVRPVGVDATTMARVAKGTAVRIESPVSVWATAVCS